uniref:Uncharacterized protein n=1 Tax=Romanomermis culicivorax TaxID=13658 RepID=A0A915K8R3_ROMCU
MSRCPSLPTTTTSCCDEILHLRQISSRLRFPLFRELFTLRYKIKLSSDQPNKWACLYGESAELFDIDSSNTSGDQKTRKSYRNLFAIFSLNHSDHKIVNLLVAIGTNARIFVVFCTINVGTIIERKILLANGSPTTLIGEVPMAVATPKPLEEPLQRCALRAQLLYPKPKPKENFKVGGLKRAESISIMPTTFICLVERERMPCK